MAVGITDRIIAQGPWTTGTRVPRERRRQRVNAYGPGLVRLGPNRFQKSVAENIHAGPRPASRLWRALGQKVTSSLDQGDE